MKKVQFQLYEGIGGFPRGEMIRDSGGVVYVAAAGDAAKQAITDADGNSLSNPYALTQGGAEFYVPNSVSTVDLYIQTPNGAFVVEKSVVPGEAPDIAVDMGADQMMVIPFAIGDTTAATETDTGFDLPTKALIHPTAFIDVLTVDATETIDVGTDSGDSGDADGFLAVVSVATAGLAKGTLASGGQTLGALLSVDESGAGVLVPEGRVSDGKSVTYTLTAGTDTAEGFIHLPYTLVR